MKKIAAIFFMLFFIGPSTLPAGITHTVLPANTAASGSAAVQNAAGIQKSVAQVTSNSQPQAVVPPAQNVLPPQKASSNQPELPVKVPAALQKNPLPSNPVVPPNPPKIDTKPGAVSGEPGKSAEASTSSGPQSVRSTIPPRPRFLSQGHVSLNFDDADIYSVIQTVFGEILRVNYIIDARVKGRVTFRSVSPVAREKVLPLMEVILKLNGAAIVEDGELYRIVPSELKDKKGIRVFIYHVQNAKAKDITNMLQQLFLGGRSQTTDGSAKSTSESTSLSSASPAQFSKAVVAGSRQSGAEGILSDDVKIFADEKLNAVVFLGTREDYDIIKQTISELDI
ncbi:MAG: secretin N-terminal domain-containing protein, partial [Smithellaceae bacterium]